MRTCLVAFPARVVRVGLSSAEIAATRCVGDSSGRRLAMSPGHRTCPSQHHASGGAFRPHTNTDTPCAQACGAVAMNAPLGLQYQRHAGSTDGGLPSACVSRSSVRCEKRSHAERGRRRRPGRCGWPDACCVSWALALPLPGSRDRWCVSHTGTHTRQASIRCYSNQCKRSGLAVPTTHKVH